MSKTRKGRRMPPPFFAGQRMAEVAHIAKQTGREIKTLDIQTPGKAYSIKIERKTDVALAIQGLGIQDVPILFATLHYPDCALTLRYVPDAQGHDIDWRVTEVAQ